MEKARARFFSNFLKEEITVILEQGFHFLLEEHLALLIRKFVLTVITGMKQQRTQFTINALILTAALNNDFGVTKARLAQELVLTYRKVNKHCEELVKKRLLGSNKWHVVYLGCNHEVIKSAQEITNGVIESRYDLESGSKQNFYICHGCTGDETTGRTQLEFCSNTVPHWI